MADLGVPEVVSEGHLSEDQSRAAATAITNESSTKTTQVITNESSTKATRSRLLKLICNDSSTKATRSRISRRHLSAIDKDLMESSRKGDLAGVRYEDEKGLGGCRLQ